MDEVEEAALKPGYLTTEFYSTMLAQLVGIVALVVTGFGGSLDAGRLQPLIPAAALIASSVASAVYARSRSHTKASALAQASRGRHAA